VKLWARVWCLVFLTHSVYTVCLFISYASPLILFSSLFLTYLLPFVSFPLRIDPLRFHARCCKKMTKPGFSFLCLFCVVVHFFWYVNVCFCCVRFSFFPYKANRCLGKCLLKWPILCWVGHKTTTQSINQQLKCWAILPCDLSLIIIHISNCRQFSDINILQGSVATYLRCGGIFIY